MRPVGLAVAGSVSTSVTSRNRLFVEVGGEGTGDVSFTSVYPSIISFSMRNGQRREVKFLPAPEGEKRAGVGAGIRTRARPRARFPHPFHAPPPQRSQGTAACVAAVRSPADCGSMNSVRATSFPPQPQRQESVGLRAGADGEAKRTGLSCPGARPQQRDPSRRLQLARCCSGSHSVAFLIRHLLSSKPRHKAPNTALAETGRAGQGGGVWNGGPPCEEPHLRLCPSPPALGWAPALTTCLSDIERLKPVLQARALCQAAASAVQDVVPGPFWDAEFFTAVIASAHTSSEIALGETSWLGVSAKPRGGRLC